VKPSIQKTLRVLQEAGARGATTHDFYANYCGHFGGRIEELRKLGYLIDTERIENNQSRYYLRREPSAVFKTPSGSERGEQEPAALFELRPAASNSAVLQDWDDAA
jgi:hypothetical protein